MDLHSIDRLIRRLLRVNELRNQIAHRNPHGDIGLRTLLRRLDHHQQSLQDELNTLLCEVYGPDV